MAKKIPPLDLSGLPVTYQMEIPEDFLDAFGHMNVMWYTNLFGQAFGRFGREFGFDIPYFRDNHRGSFALETHIRYLAEVRVGWHVTIRSRAIARSDKRFHFVHFMSVDETGNLAAVQENIAAHMDMNTRRMSAIPPEICERFDALVARQNALGWEPPLCGVMTP
jgi:acyl-CoA thioesterase FadM